MVKGSKQAVYKIENSKGQQAYEKMLKLFGNQKNKN